MTEQAAHSGLRIIFAGTPEFAARHLQALLDHHHQVVAVYTQPDRPAGRGRQLQKSAVKIMAEQHHLPIEQPENFASLSTLATLQDYHADLMIVVAYGLLLPLTVLHTPRLGCMNVHASLLPRWRGAAPIQRALLAGDQETGVSIMRMEQGLDTGPVYRQRACVIAPQETSSSLHDKLALLGTEALLETLAQCAKGHAEAKSQALEGACYAKKIHKQEALLNWERSAIELERQIRAFYAWPVAYTYVAGTLLRIWRAEAVVSAATGAPGQVLVVSPQGIDVMTAHGTLRLLEIQWPGGKVLPASTVLQNSSSVIYHGVVLGYET